LEFDPSTPPINEALVDHHCFGCGNMNPIGLQLRFRRPEAGGVWATFTPEREHEGYLGMTHGGILSTILDEAMSWAITADGDLGVTARMNLTFRQPARIGEELRVVARVTKRRGRLIDAEAELVNAASGQTIASAEARFLRVSPEQAATWREGYGAPESSAFGRAARASSGDAE
jgi:uncharacterized protein (TIGR00369 family)